MPAPLPRSVELVVLDVGRGRHPAHPGLRRLRHARASAGRRVPGMSEPSLVADGCVGPRHGRRSHGQPAAVARPTSRRRTSIANVALDEDPTDPSHDEHRRVRAGRCPHRPEVRVRSSTTTTSGSRCSSRPATPRPGRPGRRAEAADAAAAAHGRPVRTQVGDHRHRPSARSPADGRPAVAGGRRLPGGGRRCRSDARRHRRPLHLSRWRRVWRYERGRRSPPSRTRCGCSPTWINGGGECPGPGGAVIAAMLAVASGLCRHVLCFRTVWESTFAAHGCGAGAAVRVAASAAATWSGACRTARCRAANWIGMNA